MKTEIDLSPQSGALGRIRRLSRPINILLGIALAVSIAVPIAEILITLFYADHLGSFRAFVSDSGWGMALSVVDAHQHLRTPGQIPLDSLSVQQRCATAGLGGLCALCAALALNQIRQLFGLYSRGVVFAKSNISRIKGFGMCVIAAAIAANVSGRIFERITHVSPEGTANAALAVMVGAMIYVIAHVMELGRGADLETKDFI